MSIRVYPIRMTRKEWRIGLYTIHECAGACNYTLVKDRRQKKYKCTIRDDRLVGDCSRKNNIENTIISINNFDIRNPAGIFGELYLANNVVIPHNEFTMILQFPFHTKLKITVNEPLGNGFTLKEVLYAIKLSYQDIYETESQTSSTRMYILIRECEECHVINIKKKIHENKVSRLLTHDHIDQECSICKEDITIDNDDPSTGGDRQSMDIDDTSTDIVQLEECHHIFHEACIDKWVESNGKTCPLCRKVLYDCRSCDGSAYKTIYHEGVVPPLEYRGTEPRVHTDGLYGIYDYYLEDLYVNALKYNNETCELFVSVQT